MNYYKERGDFEKFARSSGVSGHVLDDYNRFIEKDALVNPTVVEESIKNITTIDVCSRLLMERQIMLSTDINDDISGIVTAQLLWLEMKDPQKPITMLINSPGGSVTSGLAIVDTMDIVRCDIATQITGLAASMGAVISSNGTKGMRYMLPHSRLMIHQPMGGVAPHTQASDMLISAEQIKICRDELYEILAANSNLSFDEIAEKADRDCWMRANEAIEYGFVDEITKKH